jgi:LysR family transcriptional regulator, low CO2-responsive transcriptional regulator
MEIQQARIVQALAVEGTMIGAAERLGITQPAVSAALGTVESVLAVKLFLRSPRGLTLTEHGVALLPKVRQLLELNSSISQYGKEISSEEGSIRIAGRQGFMQYIFPLLLDRLRKTYPRIRVDYALSGEQGEVLDALRTGVADFAFAASPKVKSISSEVFFHDPVWLAVSPNHPLAQKKRVVLSDLEELPICLPAKHDRLRGAIERFLRKAGAHNILLETNDYTLMKNIILTGEGAGFIYGHMLTQDAGELRPLHLKEFELTRDLTVLHRRDDLAPHAETARNFILNEAVRILKDVVKQAKRNG